MILNKTTEYALTVLGFMAVSEEEIFSAEFLHEKLAIPRRYLRKLMTDLSKLGLIRSEKGRSGGFVFARPLEEVSLSYIIEKVEGTAVMKSCLIGHTSCNLEQPCIMHNTWSEAKSKMIETLSNTTLLDLRTRNRLK